MPPEETQVTDDISELDSPEETPEESEETPVEETEETEESPEEEETAEDHREEIETQEAIQLYNALKDPQSAQTIIKLIADQHNLDLSVDTKKGARETQRDVVKIFEDALGDDYKFLAPKIGPAIEQAINVKLQDVKNSQMERDVDNAVSWLSKETDGDSDKHIDEIAALSNELVMAPNGDVKQYLKRLYSIASSGKAKTAAKRGIASKIARNRKDAGDRLASSSRGTGKPASKPADNAHSAVEMAMRQLKMTE